MTARAQKIFQQLHQRCERFVATSIDDLFANTDVFLSLDQRQIDWLIAHRRELEQLCIQLDRGPENTIDAPAPLAILVFHLRRFLKNNNQFLVLTHEQQHMLIAVYRQFFRALAGLVGDERLLTSASIRMMLQQHRERLRQLMQTLGLRSTPRLPLCHDYSAELQMALLGFNERLYRSPLLDLGCGERGTLVNALRQRGINAVGVDRFVLADRPWFFQMDWLAFPLESAQWSTIVSHMAFSLHFLHHYLTTSDSLRVYIHRYMHILEALCIGGCFIYAPGLPFIEHLLPEDRFSVTVMPIQDHSLMINSNSHSCTCVCRRA